MRRRQLVEIEDQPWCPARPVVACCRGPYRVHADEAVERLRRRGYDARRPSAAPRRRSR